MRFNRCRNRQCQEQLPVWKRHRYCRSCRAMQRRGAWLGGVITGAIVALLKLLLVFAVFAVGGCAAGDRLVIGYYNPSEAGLDWRPRARALQHCPRVKFVVLEDQREVVILQCSEHLFVAVDHRTRTEITRGEWFDQRFLPR